MGEKEKSTANVGFYVVENVEKRIYDIHGRLTKQYSALEGLSIILGETDSSALIGLSDLLQNIVDQMHEQLENLDQLGLDHHQIGSACLKQQGGAA